MRSYLCSLIFLLLAGFVFGSATDQQDFVTFVYANGVGSSGDNGGGCTKQIWDVENHDALKFMESDGGPLVAASLTVVNVGGEVGFTEPGGASDYFADMVDGTFVLIDSYSGDDISDGRYIAEYADDDTIYLVDTIYVDDAGQTGGITLGGAIDGLASLIAFESDLADAGLYNCDVLIRGNETLPGTIAIGSGGGGSSSLRLRLLSVNSSWAYEKGAVTLTATANLVNGLIRFGTGTGISYVDIIGFVIDGGGAGNAEKGLSFPDADSDFIHIIDCTIQDVIEPPGYGIEFQGDAYAVINTTVAGCRYGIFAGTGDAMKTQYLHSSFRDNGVGVHVDATDNHFIHCEFIDSSSTLGTGDGLVFDDVESFGTVQLCSFLNNDGDGMQINVASLQIMVLNNASSGNGGFGYNISDNNVTSLGVFGYNHSYNETDCSDTGTWATLGIGNNITGDPKFNNVADGSEDLDLQASSPLIAAGVNGANIGSGNHAVGGGGGQPILGGSVVR